MHHIYIDIPINKKYVFYIITVQPVQRVYNVVYNVNIFSSNIITIYKSIYYIIFLSIFLLSVQLHNVFVFI